MQYWAQLNFLTISRVTQSEILNIAVNRILILDNLFLIQ